mmetsp:Transcript_37801/g.60925  ORF Transcript_37801/g.60925 Transcript_37801/m.60925 type:complete len:84 (-) Transcript_37801:194-445(-)
MSSPHAAVDLADPITSGSAADFKVKEKAVLAYLLTIPEVAAAVALQCQGRSQDAKTGMRAAVAQFPSEILKRAGAAPGTQVMP